jgi:hypothetical protein
MGDLAGRVFVLLDGGDSAGSADLARGLAEAGAAIVTVHGQGRGADGRAVYIGDPSDSIDIEAASTMAAELFGPVDAVVDLAELPVDPAVAVQELRLRFPR